jgi:transcriptional regulator with XRE-family HTH domain
LVDLADRLIWAREQKGWTQEQLANAAEVSQSTIGNLESRLRRSARKLAVIANVLDVDAYWLETGEGSPKAQPQDELFAQISTLSPAERHIVATVVAGLKGVTPGPRVVASATNAGSAMDEQETRVLALYRRATKDGKMMILGAATVAPKAAEADSSLSRPN